MLTTSRMEFSLSNLASSSGRKTSQSLPTAALGPPRPAYPGARRHPAPAAATQQQQTDTYFRPRRRGRRLHCVRCSAAAISLGSEAGATISGAVQPVKQAASDLLHRAISGSLLGLTGAAVILAGGWVFTIATCLLVYQFSQEFFGFVTSKGISEGMLPPPPLVSALTSLLCICVTVWTHISAGNSTAALAVSSFLVLSLQLLTVERPHFSQMTSTVFGLFYCGKFWRQLLSGLLRMAMQALHGLPAAAVHSKKLPLHSARSALLVTHPVLRAGYLPSFWVKLRLLAVPAINSTLVHGWPVSPTSRSIVVASGCSEQVSATSRVPNHILLPHVARGCKPATAAALADKLDVLMLLS